MNTFRRCIFLVGLPVVAELVGCEHAKAPGASDTAGTSSNGSSTHSALHVSSTWDRGAGPLLLVSADTASRAFVVVPDSATAPTTLANIPHDASVTLFGRGGTVQTAELQAIGDSDGCPIAGLRAAPPPRPWSVGFIGGVVAPLPIDSAANFSPADSSALVVAMNRLASALPNDTAGRFEGLPFVVRTLWRLTLPDGRQVVVATLGRQLNQEATPLAEHTFLVAERAPNDTAFAAAYSERSYGNEETIESNDVLAAALIGGTRTPSIIVSRDFGDYLSYALLERGSDGRWHERWSSSRRHC